MAFPIRAVGELRVSRAAPIFSSSTRPHPFLCLSSLWAFFPLIPSLSLSLPFIRSFLPLFSPLSSPSHSFFKLALPISLLSCISLLSTVRTPWGMSQRLR